MPHSRAVQRLRAVPRRWRRTLAGTAAIVWLGSSALPAGAIAVAPTDGTLAVSPTTVTAGNSQAFMLTFTATMRLEEGTVILQVPAGWPAPQTQTASSDGFTTCATCTPTISDGEITVTDLTLAPPGAASARLRTSVTVTYSATVPPSATSGTFAAEAQQTSASPLLSSNSVTVTVTPVFISSTTPPSSPASSSSSTPASTSPGSPASTSPASPASSPASTSPSTPAPPPASSSLAAGPGSPVSIPIVLILATAFAAVFLAGWFLHHPAPPIPQSVQAVPHAGSPARLSVRAVGPDATLTVRIEPHPGAATTTTREPAP